MNLGISNPLILKWRTFISREYQSFDLGICDHTITASKGCGFNLEVCVQTANFDKEEEMELRRVCQKMYVSRFAKVVEGDVTKIA